MTPRLLHADVPQHAVERAAAELARALGEPLHSDASGATRAHLHFTDRLWGASPEEAALRVEALCVATPLTVTLHDLPQASDGPQSRERRAACFRRVVAAARGVVCTSHHEVALLREALIPDAAPVVIPLPVLDTAAGPPPPPDDEVVVLGFFYPGKGHAEVVEAVAGFGRPGLGVTVLGRASPGHERELEQLAADAAARGVRLTVTGYLDDATLLARCRRARVPVAAHQHVSASGSIASWIGAGRRPLVPRTRYTAEMETLRPGTLTRYAALPTALANALDDPASTWRAADAVLAPGLRETAAAYARWWAQDVAW